MPYASRDSPLRVFLLSGAAERETGLAMAQMRRRYASQQGFCVFPYLMEHHVENLLPLPVFEIENTFAKSLTIEVVC